jgi:pimeloyl-ACP methyl ester carboxylesterase
VWTRAMTFVTGTMQRGQGLAASTLGSRASLATPARAEPVAVPRTRWADAGGVSIAYQEFGEGPRDLVLTFGWLTHVEMAWRHPALASFLRRLGTLGRVLFFDKRGVGLSDRGQRAATLEERVADVLAVMDAAGSERAMICGVTQGVASCVATAALHPDRVGGAVLLGGTAKTLRSPDHPLGSTPEALEQRVEDIRTRWGEPLFVEQNAPSMSADPGFRAWWAEALRMSASPSHAIALLRATAEVDLRPLLPRVAAPTLVLHRRGDRVVSLEEARDLASRVPGARLVELPGEDHLPYTGDVEPLFAELARFLGSP